MENGKISLADKTATDDCKSFDCQASITDLDDSLSALDYQTDLDLRKALQTYLGSTVIIISQRVRSIQEAHHILVMDQGKIAAQGTHEELLAQSAEYQEIVASQEEE